MRVKIGLGKWKTGLGKMQIEFHRYEFHASSIIVGTFPFSYYGKWNDMNHLNITKPDQYKTKQNHVHISRVRLCAQFCPDVYNLPNTS